MFESCFGLYGGDIDLVYNKLNVIISTLNCMSLVSNMATGKHDFLDAVPAVDVAFLRC